MPLQKVKSIASAIRNRWRMMLYSHPLYQREHWRRELAQYDWDAQQIYGYEWGDPEKANDRLGNYLAIKNRLTALVTQETVVVDIGSLGGKWTQYFVCAKEVICVDINDLGFRYIQKKFPQVPLRFYLSKGDELRGIAGQSVDLVFSMDTFVRVPKRCIFDYFKEMGRVLRPGGKMLIHLPCTIKLESRRKLFVDLTLEEIERACHKQNFKRVSIDTDIIHHGVIVDATKG